MSFLIIHTEIYRSNTNNDEPYFADKNLIYTASDENVTALWLAVCRGDVKVTKTLLRRGADPNMCSNQPFTCPHGHWKGCYGPCSILDLAVFRQDVDVMQLLIDFGVRRSTANASLIIDGTTHTLIIDGTTHTLPAVSGR